MSAKFGAASDSPIAIARRALREFDTAVDDDDGLGIREAAEKGWLAICAVADVAADRLDIKSASGANGRFKILRELETRSRTNSGDFTGPFDIAHKLLHADCFHEDNYDVGVVKHCLDGILDAAETGMVAIERAKRRSKR